MLRHEISSPPVRLLLSVLVLKDAGRNHYALPGVDPVVSHESGDLADDGYKALLHQAPCLARVGHALVAPYRSVRTVAYIAFALPPFPSYSYHDTKQRSCQGVCKLPLSSPSFRHTGFSESRLHT